MNLQIISSSSDFDNSYEKACKAMILLLGSIVAFIVFLSVLWNTLPGTQSDSTVRLCVVTDDGAERRGLLWK